MTVFVFGISVGWLVSLRFNVVILVPVGCLGLMIVGVSSIARGDSAWAIIGSMAVITASMQVGYLIGSVLVRCEKRGSNHGMVSVPTELSRPA
jgi:hypothetical protein